MIEIFTSDFTLPYGVFLIMCFLSGYAIPKIIKDLGIF